MFSMTDENWRKDNKTITSKMKVILRQQIFTDVVFNVQGREFKCHRLILALGSPYFERTFYHTFQNTNSPSISISDVTPESFQCVLNFLYTDKITFGNETQAFETFEAAEKFQIYDLKSECEIFLSELDFRPHSIWNNLDRAAALKMEKIERKYFRYIENNSNSCLQEDAFLKASGDVVMKIMTSGRISIPEVELANRLAAWVKAKNPKYMKVIMDPFLRHIRFRAMTPKEFCSFTSTNRDILDSADSLAILQHLELPAQNKLPYWCCQLPKRMGPA